MDNYKKPILFLLYGFIFFSLADPYQYTVPGLDQSWQQALSMAVDNKFTFGIDFIFNYGPLGYLYTTLFPKSVPIFVQFIFHCFVLLNYLLIINEFAKKYPNRYFFIFIIAVFAIYPSGNINDVAFTLFFFLLFWILNFHYTQNHYVLSIIVIIAVLNFYIKHNLSIASYIAVIIAIFNWLYFKKISLKRAFDFLMSLIFLTIITAQIFNVALKEYIIGAFNIISAYSSGMSIIYLYKLELLTLLVFKLLIILLIILVTIKKVSFKKDILLIFCITYYLFIVFKQSTTAYSIGSSYNFFASMPALIILLIYYPNLKANTQLVGLLIKVILISLFLIVSFLRLYGNNNLSISTIFNTHIKFLGIKSFSKNGFLAYTPYNYFKKLFEYDYENNFSRSNLSKTQLPPQILKIIGKNSIDVIPDNLSYVYFNKLNYNNRPIIQTYQANSNWLEDVNGNKLKNPKMRPAFVLANISSFRNQHPYWIDKSTYLELLINYLPIKRFSINNDTLILFKGNNELKPVKVNFIKTINNFMLSDTINVPPNNNEFVYFKSRLQIDLPGYLVKLIFQPPQIWCTLILEDNSVQSFRIPPSLLQSGILVNYHVYTHEDFYNLSIKNNGELKKIKSIIFNSLRNFGFKKSFTGQFYTINN